MRSLPSGVRPRPEYDDDVDAEDQRRQPGQGHGVGEQPVDAGDHLGLRAGDDGDRDEARHREGDRAGVVRPVGQQT